MTEPSTPSKYLQMLMQHIERTGTSPGLHHIEVRHDPWCGIFEDDECDCEPDIVSGPLIDRKYQGEPEDFDE